jgi:hypothetical protein
MKTKKLSLDEFKALEKNVKIEEAMEQVNGGNWSDCHGFWGTVGKSFRMMSEFQISM